jgi:diadenosine tetraphosphate (Ap4A) HIT family hydrolase
MQAGNGISVLAVGKISSARISRSSSPVSHLPWSLHPQLARDTVEVGDLALSRLLAMNDANYPWVILVPRRAAVVEIIDLDASDRTRLMSEIAQVSAALKQLTACDKLNVAAIGNVVPQLHVHVVARRTDDSAWPKPVWGAVPARPYRDEDVRSFAASLRRAVGLG